MVRYFVWLTLLGAVLTAGISASAAHAQTIEQRTASCMDYQPQVCAALYDEYYALKQADRITDAEWPRWKPALERACGSTLRVGQACTELGFVVGTGKYGEPVDLPTALQHYNRGCEANVANACLSSGQYWRLGLGLRNSSANPATALMQYKKACRLGSKVGCDWVSDIVHLKNAEYPDIPYDFAASAEAEYYECVNNGNCAWIANAYWDGREGLDPYTPRAARVYLAMCRAGDGRFCYGAASSISRDRDYTPAGWNLAYYLDRKACELGFEAGCTRSAERAETTAETSAPFIDPTLPENEQFMIAKLALDEGEYAEQMGGIATIRWLAQMEVAPAQFEASNWFFFGLPDPANPGTMIVAQNRDKASELLNGAAESGIAEAAFWFAVLREKDADFGAHVYPDRYGRANARAHYLGSPNILVYEERQREIRRLQQQRVDAARAAQHRERILAEQRAQQDLFARALENAFGASSDQVCANVIQGGRMTRECVSRSYARRNWPGNY